MKLIRLFLIALGLAAMAPLAAAEEPIRAVYDLMEGNEQATRAMYNIRNHLDADPTVKIVVVTHGAGIDFLLEGAKDARGRLFAGPIGELANRGVVFRLCKVTLDSRQLKPEAAVLEASVVPSGVAEVARLQAREHYVYLRP